MKPLSKWQWGILIFVVTGGFFAFNLIQTTEAVISDGSAAVNLAGQLNNGLSSPDYTKGAANNGPSAQGFSGAIDSVVDTTNHRLFVADTANNRVLVYNLNGSDVLTDYTADYVLGQTGFTTNSSGTSSGTLNNPQGLAFDSTNNRLFVADTMNNRVLVFNTSSLSSGMAASNVLGQASFGASSSATSQSGMNQPVSVAYKSSNSILHVADQNNHRVLIFDVRTSGGSTDLCSNSTNTTGISNGMNASCVIGQTNFTSGSNNRGSSTAANSLSSPSGVTFYASSNWLFIADMGNSRVVAYTEQDSANILFQADPNAAKVLGQANYTSSSSGTTQSTLSGPRGVQTNGLGGSGRLYVGDSSNNRIMVFNIGDGITDGESAVNVLGQSNFTSSSMNQGGSAPSQSGLYGPRGMGYNATQDKLWVMDTNNSRAVEFNVNTSTISDGASAVNGAGQLNSALTSPLYTKGGMNNGPSPFGFSSSNDTALDTTNHRLFVADSSNNRVLAFNLNDSDALTDYQADYVLGQADFNSSTMGTSSTTMNGPNAVAFSSNKLYVSDQWNHRVLIFNLGGGISNGMAASNVMGQANFNSGSSNRGGSVANNTLSSPVGLAYDGSSNYLYAADSGNHRVVVFDLVSIADGEAAAYELGQANFTTGSSNRGGSVANNTLSAPAGVAYASNKLYVGDSGNHRVLAYNTSSLSNGMAASNVLGQANFSSGSANRGGSTASNTLSAPKGVALDTANNRLFVADYSNHRLLAFTSINSMSDGMAASNVLGQANFTTGSSSSASTTRLNSPFGLVYNSTNGQLWTADSMNHRLMAFDAAANTAPTVSANSATQRTDGSNIVDISVTVSDAEANGLKIRVERAADGDSNATCNSSDFGSPLDVTLNETASNVTASVGTKPDVENDNAYQVGTSTSINTSSSNTVTFLWDNPFTDSLSMTGYYCLMFTPNDGTSPGTSAYQRVTLDTQWPSSPGNVSLNSRSTTSLTFNFGSAASDTNFGGYKLNYRTGSDPGVGCSASSQWTSTQDTDLSASNFNGTTDTQVTGLSTNTQYTFNICAYDTYGHSTPSGGEVTQYTAAAVPGAPLIANATTNSIQLTPDTNGNPASTGFAILAVDSGQYVQANGTLGVGAVWQTSAQWGTVTVTGLSPNTAYQFQVKARDGDSIETSLGSANSAVYTLANTGGAPTVNSPGVSSLNVVIDTNNNPASTQFAIQEPASGQYVQAAGTLGASAVWQTAVQWGTVTVTGLSPNTLYQFRTKARSGDATETNFSSSSATIYTLAESTSTPSSQLSNGSFRLIVVSGNNPSGTLFALCKTSDGSTCDSGGFVQADGSLGASAVWQTRGSWGGGDGTLLSGLSANTFYRFLSQARNGDGTPAALSSASTALYTAATTPATPTVDGATSTSLDITLSANGNPATTTYAIRETGGGQYVQADGTLGASAVYKTLSQWGTVSGVSGKITVTGLSSSTSYTFVAVARNGDGVDSAASVGATLATTSGGSARQREGGNDGGGGGEDNAGGGGGGGGGGISDPCATLRTDRWAAIREFLALLRDLRNEGVRVQDSLPALDINRDGQFSLTDILSLLANSLCH